jgi:uncharacterized protein (DUF2384 family)
MAERVFGDRASAWRWLRKPNSRFEGRAPLAMLEAEDGARLVEEAIVQISHGMFA